MNAKQDYKGLHPSLNLASVLFTCAGLLVVAAVAVTPRAHADTVAYLINVTVRRGYNFASADAALAYGHRICDKISEERSYVEIVGDIKRDFATSDQYQATYLIGLAANEPCPALIWQLRNSAAHYRPPAANG